jgi:transposase InsO family protein
MRCLERREKILNCHALAIAGIGAFASCQWLAHRSPKPSPGIRPRPFSSATMIALMARCSRDGFGRWGIRDRPITPRSSWQNGHVERTIGSIRRECLNHMIVWSEAHLRRVLKEYTSYYNVARTHLGLQKDAPHRRPIERHGRIVTRDVLGGLHHQYCRI